MKMKYIALIKSRRLAGGLVVRAVPDRNAAKTLSTSKTAGRGMLV